MTNDTDRHCIDLTQLSSREQLSALMDGALPEDQTRFLLRRLQHDAELACSWERWRIASDVMRGLAPARHLPPDFAARVFSALHGGQDVASQRAGATRFAWLRWGGGMGMVAAALAVVALMARPSLEPERPQAAPLQLAATTPAPSQVQGQPAAPVPQPPRAPALADAPDMLAVAAVAAVAKPLRRAKPRSAPGAVAALPAAEQVAAAAPPAADFPTLPQADIVTRPWPRSILSQYGNGSGLTVGFGDHLPRAADNPFTPPVFGAPPKLLSDPGSPATDAGSSPGPADAGRDAPADAQTQP